MVEDRIRDLEQKVEQLGMDQDQREAMALLPQRVDDLREALKDVRALVGDFRQACDDRLDALTRERPNGGYEARPGKVDFKTWILFTSTVVIPILLVLLTR